MAAPVVAAFNFVDTLAQVGTTVSQVDEILKAEEQEHGTRRVAFTDHSIEVKNISFGYHDDQEILHNASLSIPQNRMTALVGSSGSGKSTIAKLIAGFWDVKNGTITTGGHDLKEISLDELYDQVAFVSQDNYLFDDTVRENIRMGRRDAGDAEVEAAAHNAGSFIHDLENGFDTIVGGGGAHLSGGERQRIAIARAMLKDVPSHHSGCGDGVYRPRKRSNHSKSGGKAGRKQNGHCNRPPALHHYGCGSDRRGAEWSYRSTGQA